jgi:hypothetical protein
MHIRRHCTRPSWRATRRWCGSWSNAARGWISGTLSGTARRSDGRVMAVEGRRRRWLIISGRSAQRSSFAFALEGELASDAHLLRVATAAKSDLDVTLHFSRPSASTPLNESDVVHPSHLGARSVAMGAGPKIPQPRDGEALPPLAEEAGATCTAAECHKPISDRAISAGTCHPKSPSITRGTEGSNPSPSSSESAANPTSVSLRDRDRPARSSSRPPESSRSRRFAAAGKRLCDDPPARRGSRHRHQARQPQLPSDRDHCVPRTVTGAAADRGLPSATAIERAVRDLGAGELGRD